MIEDQTCPLCSLTNRPEAQRCDCGYDFVAGKLKQSYLPSKTKKSEEIEPSSENDKEKYSALIILSVIYKTLALISGIGAVIALFYGLTLLEDGYSPKATGISLIAYSLIMGIVGVITFLATSEGIKLFIDIERNSREQISLLSKILEKK